MKSKMGCILASIFKRFWWIFGAKLGGKIDQKSIQKGIEKTMQKRRAAVWAKSRNMMLQLPGPEGILGPGEGVGVGVNPSPREEGKGLRPVLYPKPPQPRGLVGL